MWQAGEVTAGDERLAERPTVHKFRITKIFPPRNAWHQKGIGTSGLGGLSPAHHDQRPGGFPAGRLDGHYITSLHWHGKGRKGKQNLGPNAGHGDGIAAVKSLRCSGRVVSLNHQRAPAGSSRVALCARCDGKYDDDDNSPSPSHPSSLQK
ncbi:hypothetical protein ZHAS_00016072 [Anopheles sinensis]|uniref:Uncharacterized protein n=1 Tax=Anopheles sinensis TaxID=74873 RepID=A0A084WD04_ANOSI|nr:hypothetical protein ZHAS_00016072 [Anopheles sinensis]